MQKRDGFKIPYALSLATQLGFLISASIAGFILLGIWIDNIFNSSPLFLTVGVIVGFCMTVYEAYHMLLPLINSHDEE